MIDINLVPTSLRKRSSTGGLAFLSLDLPPNALLGAAVGLALLALFHVLLLLGWLLNQEILREHKSAWQKVLPQRNTIDSLSTQMRDLKKKQKDITDIASGKAGGWSYKLNVLSDGVPQGLWFRRITVDSKALSIEGSVISQNQNEVAAVSAFVNSLKADARFMEGFNGVEVDSIQKIKRGPTETADFKLTAKFKAAPEEKKK